MVRQIIWVERAQKERIEIFKYWNNRNGSFIFSKKLNELIKESLKLISNHPMIGKRSDKENIRVKVLRDYLIIYEISVNKIIVLSIWDCRQNPEDLKRVLK